MEEITPREAADLLQAKPADTILLDVREPMELELAAVQGALHIPMGEIPLRLDEIDRNKNHHLPVPLGCSQRAGCRFSRATRLPVSD